MKKKKILFLGCGNMGKALIRAFVVGGVDPESFLIIKPTKYDLTPNLKYFPSCRDVPVGYKPDIVFFCFKPQNAQEVITKFLEYISFDENTVFISILAGKKIAFFKDFLGSHIKIIRLMPNLPTLVGQGIFAYYSQSKIPSDVLFLLGLIGEYIAVDQERLLDVVTAVSGSGPAYLFYFVKSLIATAEKLGLSKDQAKKLVKKTIYGSAKMVISDPDGNLDNLLSSIASKGGTTQAALDIFEASDFDKIILSAVSAALDRAKIL